MDTPLLAGGRLPGHGQTPGLESGILVLQDLSRIRIRIATRSDQMTSTDRTRKAIEQELKAIRELPAALLRRAFVQGFR
jgi:hypothetical protein